MPVCERDPWRLQYFESVPCPDDVLIPTDDPDSWNWYPEFRWIYDKLKMAESQGLPCGPHGVMPPSFPVFSKPMMNLKGMGIGSRVIATAEEFDQCYRPGHMWMEKLEGTHVSTDCAVCDGRVVWSRHATGMPGIGGTFKYWTIHAESDAKLEIYLSDWVAGHMAGYTGMMNFETIGGRIIEAHLRFADQWCDLYGKGWVEALVKLYEKGVWDFDDNLRAEGFSLPLFARHGDGLYHPPKALQEKVRSLPHVMSLQITFHENKAPKDHAMPPGGFRLCIVNATDLAAGFAARSLLATAFPAERLTLPD
jgi:hypothetical protein